MGLASRADRAGRLVGRDRSGGRSSFTPVAVGFARAVALVLARRARRPDGGGRRAARLVRSPIPTRRPRRPRSAAAPSSTTLAGAVFVVAVALL